MMPKRTCKFNETLQKKYPFIKLKRTTSESDVLCNICRAEFSVAHNGATDISNHLSTGRHTRAVGASASSKSLTEFYANASCGTKEKQLAAAEGTLAYHTVSHNHSFRSMDCTSKLIQKMFEAKFTCSRTKAEAIVVKVLSPLAMKHLKDELENVNFVSIFIDASNHKEVKLFPILVRYFLPSSGIQVKLLEFKDLSGETSALQHQYIMETLESHQLSQKLIAFCADNANTNFGGAERKGKNNIYCKLNETLSHKVLGLGCAAHIVHNAIQSAAECLPLDIESVVHKIYMYFYIYTVRVTALQEFCDFVSIEYQKLLSYSKTRWLDMMPAIERIIKMFPGLKSYFLSLDKCPVLLQAFFEDPSAELWLYFVHNQAASFQATVLQIENQTATCIEVYRSLKDLNEKCRERSSQKFIPIILQSKLKELEKEIDTKKLQSQMIEFYETSANYLDRWSIQFEEINIFDWVLLRSQTSWEDVQKCVAFVNGIFPDKINDNELFDEISYIQRYVTAEKINEWSTPSAQVPVEKRWMEIFQHFANHYVPCDNVKLMAEFTLCLPGTNAPTERVFSLINNIWTPDKSQLKVETLKHMLVVKCNYTNYSCNEFYDMLSQNSDVLSAIHSNQKY